MMKTLSTATLLALAPLVPALSGDEVQAAHRGVSVSGGVSVVAPGFVLGFSYDDPYVMGHVHHEPAYCDYGPLYYYPRYEVYGHYHPRYSYRHYARPNHRRHYVGHRNYGHRHSVDRGHPGRHHVRFDRHRDHRRDHHYRSRDDRRDHRGRDADRRHRGRRGQRIRGH